VIRVEKPATAPRILRDANARGPKHTKKLCDEYDAGARDFDFTSDVYGAKSVRNALIKAQHGKCCFCESKITHVSYGDVEHFRPKAGYRQQAGDALGKPGYYWLAYAWANLFLSCQLCNQRFKRNLFPLAEPARRAASHHANLDAEDPLFIDPAADDPGDYIGFREEYAYAIDDNTRAIQTIEALGLNREALAERRRDLLESVKLAARTVEVLAARNDGHGRRLSAAERRLLSDHQASLAQAVLDSAQYSAMVRAARASE